jgi:hypothetical protein
LKVSESKPRSKWCCTVREPFTTFRPRLKTKVGGRSVVGLGIRIGEISRDWKRQKINTTLFSTMGRAKLKTLPTREFLLARRTDMKSLPAAKRSKPKTLPAAGRRIHRPTGAPAWSPTGNASAGDRTGALIRAVPIDQLAWKILLSVRFKKQQLMDQ